MTKGEKKVCSLTSVLYWAEYGPAKHQWTMTAINSTASTEWRYIQYNEISCYSDTTSWRYLLFVIGKYKTMFKIEEGNYNFKKKKYYDEEHFVGFTWFQTYKHKIRVLWNDLFLETFVTFRHTYTGCLHIQWLAVIELNQNIYT